MRRSQGARLAAMARARRNRDTYGWFILGLWTGVVAYPIPVLFWITVGLVVFQFLVWSLAHWAEGQR